MTGRSLNEFRQIRREHEFVRDRWENIARRISPAIGRSMGSSNSHFDTVEREGCVVLQLQSADGTNRLTRTRVNALSEHLATLACRRPLPLVITGSSRFFSAGADLKEISELNGPDAFKFSKMGQHLMSQIAEFPAPVYAAISGYCMGGGLDLVLACHRRIASPEAVFGHRGAALGLLTGWGGTQRLPRLIGKGRALEMFVTAMRLDAEEALRLGLVDAIADDPVAEALRRITAREQKSAS
jgi:enoyl-CoA hydratase